MQESSGGLNVNWRHEGASAPSNQTRFGTGELTVLSSIVHRVQILTECVTQLETHRMMIDGHDGNLLECAPRGVRRSINTGNFGVAFFC